ELVGLPYVGNSVLASAVGMDKHFTKTVLQGAGVTVAPWVAIDPQQWADDSERWQAKVAVLGLPVFVKPSRAGSSVGVTLVSRADDLEAALEVAWAEDTKALVEQAIVGRELECGVLSGRDGAPTRVSLAGEITVTGRDFY